jgi:phospholipase/carboxylesterase
MSEAAVELTTGPTPLGTVIWMHGLGADGHDFEPLVPELMREHFVPLRFVFPHAPVRPVTVNGGYPMRAWYDIHSFERGSRPDVAGIRASDAAIRALIAAENRRGTPTERIVLAGFSQGGAMALYSGTRLPQRLAGIMGLSAYLLMAETLQQEQSSVNLSAPIFLAHGTHDGVLPHAFGEQSRAALEAAGHSVEWHSYAMEHSLCAEEVAAIAEFLARVYADARSA